MAASETHICNMALGHVGNSNQIASLTEKSNEARACTLFYEQCRDEVLSAFPWPFATVIDALTLIETDPTTEWGHSYRYPVDALTTFRIPSGFDRLSAPGAGWCWTSWGYAVFPAIPVPYRIVSDDSGKLIYTDMASATIEYTRRLTDVAQFPADFVSALALKLAGEIAPMVTGGDQFKLGPLALQRYEEALVKAQARAANERQQDRPGDADSISARY